MLILAALSAQAVTVSTADELRTAIDNAAAGDSIELAPGTYDVSGNLSADTAGTASAPITVRADSLGDAEIRFDALEGFKVSAPHWVFENLVLTGVCSDDNDCEHAMHITGAADFTVVRNNRLVDFNAQIKGNGGDVGGSFVWPDDVLIEGNEFYDNDPRQTSNPVTKIDVVGGRRWILRSNYIHDFDKGQGNNVSYAAFLKGNSRDGLFEGNLVECESLHTGHVRLGLSFGGGGTTNDPFCEDSDCSIEHQDGTMRNNIIANCPADVGIYINDALGTKLYNNTLYRTTGIDVRFGNSDADVRNNLISGNLRERDGGTSNASSNLTGLSDGDFAAMFSDPGNLDFTLVDGTDLVGLGDASVPVTNDYCWQTRDGSPDLGAVEYLTDTPCDVGMPSLPSEGDTDTDSDTDSDSDVDTGPGGTDGGCGCGVANNAGSAWLGFAMLLIVFRPRERR